MKQLVAYGMMALILAVIAFLAVRIYADGSEKKAAAERIKRIPEFSFVTLSGEIYTDLDIEPSRPLLLVYFTSTCRYCISEIRGLKAHAGLRDAAQVVMVSPESQQTLEAFAQAHVLGESPNIRVLRDPDGSFSRIFGVSTVPNTFIYGPDRILKRHFRGEVSAEILYRMFLEDSYVQYDLADT